MSHLMAAGDAAQGAAQAGAQGMPQGAPPAGMGTAGGPPGAGGAGGLFMGPTAIVVIGVLFVITLVVLAIVFWSLFKKAGKSPALGLLMAIPVVNLGVGLWLAYSRWPIEKEAERARLLAAAERAEDDYSYDATGLSMPVPES